METETEDIHPNLEEYRFLGVLKITEIKSSCLVDFWGSAKTLEEKV